MAVVNELEKRPAKTAKENDAATASIQPRPAEQNGQHAGGDGQVERDRLRMMMLIRRFEEKTYQEYTNPRDLPGGTKEPKIGGFCHLYSGQEAVAVGIAALFQKGRDALVNGYRCHGHSLALGMDPRLAMAELFGRATGCSKGKGGSMHFFDAAVGNMGGHGIVGGHVPLGLGFAFAQGYKQTGGVTFCLFGDGAVNQGTHNETLNMASLLKAPVIFIVENNGVAMGTQVERSSADPDLSHRGLGYNMPSRNIDGNDVDTVIAELGKAAERARKMEGPSYIVANTWRIRGHSMSDPLKYRTREQIEQAKALDPITIYSERLRTRGLVTQEQVETIEDEVSGLVAEAVRQAEADPNPPLDDRFNDILAERYPYEAK